MASDQVVAAADVLRSLMRLRRLGLNAIMEELESQEGDLMEFVLEETSRLHQQLLKTAAKPKYIRQIFRDTQSLVLVALLSLREGHLRLWRQDLEQSILSHLESAAGPGTPMPLADLPAEPDDQKSQEIN